LRVRFGEGSGESEGNAVVIRGENDVESVDRYGVVIRTRTESMSFKQIDCVHSVNEIEGTEEAGGKP
jgi:hypothetical protein